MLCSDWSDSLSVTHVGFKRKKSRRGTELWTLPVFGFDGDGMMLLVEWEETGAGHGEGVVVTATEAWTDALAKQVR